MAVNWLWKNKMGEITIKMTNIEGEKIYKRNLYAANCLFVAISEWKDEKSEKDMYSVIYFIADLAHLRRCLGLSRNHDGTKEDMYKDCFVSMRLNTFFKESTKIASLFTKAGHEVTLYYDEIKSEQ